MATKLAKEGALVFISHAACQIERLEVIVVSTAIHPDNQSWWKLTSAVFLSFIAVTSWLIS